MTICTLIAAIATFSLAQQPNSHQLKFEISFPASLQALPVDGRILLAISKEEKPEPRFGIDEDETKSQQLFGLNVNALKPDVTAVVDASALGYPVRSLDQVPSGEYYVQAVLNVYETFKRSDGCILKLPADKGEGQQWNLKPGNLFSKPKRIQVDQANGGVIHISLTEIILPIEPPKDSKYVKHFRIQSKLLSEFWGRPMYLGGIIIVPDGFEEHPDAHYPLLVYQDHFSADLPVFISLRSDPPAADAKGTDLKWQKEAHHRYQDWTSGRLPHALVLYIQDANPYFDDCYGVNSVNVGPYGDAIVKELIPEVERRYRGIGQGWARGQFGGSTGGWAVLAQQVLYPDEFNWTYSFCSDPIDFHAYELVDIYNDKNAFWLEGPFGRVPRPEMRNNLGLVKANMEPYVRREEVIGTNGRSAEQFGIWQAVYSPVGPDGYPKPIWDPTTGVIDASVAKYWQEHYDLSHIMQRDWMTLGPKLVGKIHLAVGDMDEWYLTNAIHLFQDFHDSAKNPYKVADFCYVQRRGHGFSLGENVVYPAGELFQKMVTLFAERIEKTAPKDADLSWKY